MSNYSLPNDELHITPTGPRVKPRLNKQSTGHYSPEKYYSTYTFGKNLQKQVLEAILKIINGKTELLMWKFCKWQKLENETQRQYPQEKIAVHWQHHDERTEQQQGSLIMDTGIRQLI